MVNKFSAVRSHLMYETRAPSPSSQQLAAPFGDVFIMGMWHK